MTLPSSFRLIAPCLAALAIGSVLLPQGGKPPPIPDFTKGAPIPERAEHDWQLGPTGARGWIHLKDHL